jgi:hypothetical protein
VVIADARRPALARLGWDEYSIVVTLEDPPQIKVSARVYAEFGRELADFFGGLCRRPPESDDEPRRVSSSDDELCVEAWRDARGQVGLAVSLASDMWDPNWVVCLNLSVEVAALQPVATAVEQLARYAGGIR